ncbi:MAG: addiction module toxin RelE [Flavobacteriales bacterium]|nr:addiction module toxin RelE [Flavobacteriales bacterium]|tara:strand:+ start:13407 stop:13748 length:342 start_codon:yes stop_codon:yes gene_type:complete
MKNKRELYFFKTYFEEFYDNQTDKVKNKILWTLRVIRELDQIPEVYLKYIKNSSGLYEIRVQVGNNIFRVFCFFDVDNIVVIGHGFQKKSQKTPKQQIEKAEQIKREYYESKE